MKVRAAIRPAILPAMVALCGLYAWWHPLFDVSVTERLSLSLRPWGRPPAGQMFAAGAALIAALLAAWLVTRAYVGRSYERPLVFGLTMLAFVAVPGAVLGGIGDAVGVTLLRPPLGPLLTLLPALAAIVLCRSQLRVPSFSAGGVSRPSPLLLAVWGGGLALLAGGAVVGATHPAHGFDALAFHAPMAVFLWRDGSLTSYLDRGPDLFGLAHPGATHLWLGLLSLAGGERLANVGQLPFALLGSAAVAATAARHGVGRGAVLLAAAAFLYSPIVVFQAGIQAADLAGAALLMAAFALACPLASDFSRSRLALVGLGLGLTLGTRLSLLPAVVAVGAWVAWVAARRLATRGSQHQTLVPLGLAALCFLTVVAPWWARNVARYGNPIYPADLPLVGRGVSQTSHGMRDLESVPHVAYWPLYPLLEPHNDVSGFGALVAVGALPGLLVAAMRGPRRTPLRLFAFVAAVSLPAWWLFTRHEPRFLLPLGGLALAFLPLALAAAPRRLRPLGYLCIVAAGALSALITVNQGLIWSARLPTDRTVFYDRLWGIDPAVAQIPEGEGILLHTGFTGESYPALYPLLGAGRTRDVVAVDTFSVTTRDVVVATMRARGIRYAYVPASPEGAATVEALYSPDTFRLLATSPGIAGPNRAPVVRSLYVLRDGP